MCGRFTQRFSWRELHELLDLVGPAVNLAPRYNVAPGQQVATVRSEDDGQRLAMMRWGLIPSWAKEPNIGYRLINARLETARTKPSFRSAWRSRRCLIPADGFYEWTGEKKARQPWLIGMKEGGVFCFAGLWERWCVPAGLELTGSLAELGAGDALETCTILTTAANADVSPVHHRMPVILPPEAFGSWLAGDEVPPQSWPAGAMTLHPVSPWVNKATNDDPRCVEPAARPASNAHQDSWF
ncbi:MAG: SOS response-associated peptidase [bacterium]|nr:SOS response-associated peptidase [bacterium]